jgi:hypothetical protein
VIILFTTHGSITHLTATLHREINLLPKRLVDVRHKSRTSKLESLPNSKGKSKETQPNKPPVESIPRSQPLISSLPSSRHDEQHRKKRYCTVSHPTHTACRGVNDTYVRTELGPCKARSKTRTSPTGSPLAYIAVGCWPCAWAHVACGCMYWVWGRSGDTGSLDRAGLGWGEGNYSYCVVGSI